VENVIETEMKDAKTYEIGYLLTPFLPADKAEETAEAMYKMLVDDLGGSVMTKTAPKMRSLSYPVSKFINNKKSTVREAYFGAVKFQISPEKIRTIKELLEKDSNNIRFLIVNIPKNSEQVIIPRGVVAKRASSDTVKEKVVVKGEEMTNEEIDKEIEGLLDAQGA
jgi:ribosomal protein S6